MQLKRILASVILSGCLMGATGGLIIPKDATPNPNGTYSWTDRAGKKWTYLKTPFGVSRSPDTDQAGHKAPLPKGIPAGAKANPNGSYSWTDKQGAKWVYIVTPFGVSRRQATAGEESAPAPSQLAGVKTIDRGDTVRFERAMPFGISSWEKKKTDLSDEERHLVEAQSVETQSGAKATEQ